MKIRDLPEDYRRDYERGWRYSNSGLTGNPSLDHLDAKGASEAEYDGYLDAAASREKWHLAFCDNCPEHQGRIPATPTTHPAWSTR